MTREGALLKMDFPARPGKPVAVTDALAGRVVEYLRGEIEIEAPAI